MKTIARVCARTAAVTCLIAALGCPIAGQRTTFELWIVNETQYAINQIVLTNHVTAQADNVISEPIAALTLTRLELAVSEYGVDTDDVGIIGDGGILLVFPATNLGAQAQNVITVVKDSTGAFKATALAVDDRTQAAVAKAILEGADAGKP